MSYKNTMKLFASNFMLVWKQALYLLVCTIICVVCSYASLTPIISLLRENNIIEEIKMLIESVYSTPSAFALELSDVLKHMLNVVFSNFSNIWVSFIGLLILGILLPYILVQMSFYNITSILYQKLSMNMNVNYFQNGIQHLKQSLKFALASIVIGIPFLALTIILVESYLLIATSKITAIIGLFILATLFILMISIQITMHTYFTGYMVANNAGPFKSFTKGIVNTFKHFWKILSTSIIVTLTIIFVNGFITLFTFFSGLIVTIPATFVFLSIYYLVVYFNIKSERYYLATNIIYNPMKYTIKQDNFSGTEIPEETKEIEVTTVKMKKKKEPKTTKSKKIKKDNYGRKSNKK